jgi:EpsI family protein
MRKAESGFLRGNAARLLTVVLLLQAALLYGLSRNEIRPKHKPLNTVSATLGGWTLANEGVVDEDVQKVLRADDLITRGYANAASGKTAHLFVAYFQSQRAGQAPHSPKNCLPGSGWAPLESGTVTMPVSGRQDIEVNRYLVGKGDSKTLVFYWYQSRDRVVASEYTAKFYVVADAMRYNRTDTALVRVTVPVHSDGLEAADAAARDFIRTMFTPLRAHFPA